MYCRVCGKEGAKADFDELCRKCSKQYRYCSVCGGLYLKKELIDGACFMCRDDHEHLYGKE